MNVEITLLERILHTLTAWRFYKLPQSQPIGPEFPWDGFWNEPIPAGATTVPVPSPRDDYFFTFGNPGKVNYEGVAFGVPYTVRTSATPMRRVLEVREEQGHLEWKRVPMASSPWIQHHPTPYGDAHYLCIDLEERKLYEVFNLRYSILGRWECRRVTTWDLTKPYPEQMGRHMGAVGARLPLLPLMVRYEEVARGHVPHALAVAVPNYLDSFVFPAASTDGEPRNPKMPAPMEVPAGARLRITREYLESLTGVARIIGQAAYDYGIYVMDKTGQAKGSIHGAPDRRWASTNCAAFAPTIRDLELVL